MLNKDKFRSKWKIYIFLVVKVSAGVFLALFSLSEDHVARF